MGVDLLLLQRSPAPIGVALIPLPGAVEGLVHQLLIRSVSYAHMAISTRFRAPSLDIRLARWDFAVLRLMWSSSAISALVRPRATVTRTSSSRAVNGSRGCAGGASAGLSENAASSRTVTLGAMSASPLAAERIAWTSS